MTPALEAAYAEPQRRYHTRRHIAECLGLLDQVADLSPEARRVLTWAVWWHDAVYDPRASDNEDKSAEMARRDLPALGATPAETETVSRLILLTKGHAVDEADRLGATLVGIDLAVLGAEPERYDEYAADVRAEYAFVPDPAWRAGRAAVLQRFLAAPVIYADPAFRDRFEAAARANLARELASLR